MKNARKALAWALGAALFVPALAMAQNDSNTPAAPEGQATSAPANPPMHSHKKGHHKHKTHGEKGHRMHKMAGKKMHKKMAKHHHMKKEAPAANTNMPMGGAAPTTPTQGQ